MRSLCLSTIFILYFFNIQLTMGVCMLGRYYIIRSVATGLVLDASQEPVTLEYFDGYAAQSWRFDCADAPGLLNIINQSNGLYLDATRNNEPNIILSRRDDSVYQQWFVNSDGTVVNAATKLWLTAEDTAGSSLGLNEANGERNQMFTLQLKQ